MRALVTGGNGFIGSHLVDALLAAGWQVTVYDRSDRRYEPNPKGARFIKGDLIKQESIREAVEGAQVVFHLAWTNIHEISNLNPAGDVADNLRPALELLELCRQIGKVRVVFVSSGGTVYGIPSSLPIPEKHSESPITAYGISKLAVEKHLSLHRHLHGLDYLIFRPSTPFGPRQNPLARQGVVAVFLHRISNGLPITIWGDGSSRRDYFYVSDLVDALIAGATKEVKDERIFNVGGTEAIPLTRLLTLVEETVGKKADVKFVEARKFDVPNIWLDTTLARQYLGWRQRVSMQDGLSRTWQWIREMDSAGRFGART